MMLLKEVDEADDDFETVKYDEPLYRIDDWKGAVSNRHCCERYSALTVNSKTHSVVAKKDRLGF